MLNQTEPAPKNLSAPMHTKFRTMKPTAIIEFRVKLVLVAVVLGFLLWATNGNAEEHVTTIKLDWAYYNPLSLVLKDKRWLEEEFKNDGIEIQWTQSLGSNKALELLRSKSVDFGSTAGAAALLGRANGNPIKSVYVYDNPEWAALVTRVRVWYLATAGSQGKTNCGHPWYRSAYLFTARSRQCRFERTRILNLYRSNMRRAKWRWKKVRWMRGLDWIPTRRRLEVEEGYAIFFRNKTWNSYGILNVREAFAKEHPDLVRRVLAIYEKARLWTLENQNEAKTGSRRPPRIFRIRSHQSLGAPGLHAIPRSDQNNEKLFERRAKF